MARNAAGTNQYQTKHQPATLAEQPELKLLTQAASTQTQPPKPPNQDERQHRLAVRAIARKEFELAQNPAAPPDQLVRLADSVFPRVRRAALANPTTPAATLKTIFIAMGAPEWTDDPDPDVMAMLDNPNCPTWVCHRLIANRSEALNMWQKAARHPNCPPNAVQTRCAPWNGWDAVKTRGDLYWIDNAGDGLDVNALTMHWPADTLNLLATHPSFQIRVGVAASPYTPGDTLSTLTRDTSTQVVLAVAANPNTPPTTLTQLLNHKDTAVRENAARNPSTPAYAIAMLQLART